MTLRRPACTCLLIMIALVFCAPQWARSDDPAYRIELAGDVDKSQFPQVTFRFRIVDQHGKLARNLPEDEIVVFEDGKEVYRRKQRIHYEPVTAMLVIDTSGSMLLPAAGHRSRFEDIGPTKMDEAKRAADQFFQRLDASTACGLILFNHAAWLVQPVTIEKERLRELVRGAQAARDGGTAIYDSLDQALDMLPASESRRAVVLMTDGADNSSKKQKLPGIIAKARVRQISIHVIGLGEVEMTHLGQPDLNERDLKELARETQGQYYHVREADKLAAAFERVAGQLEPAYSVSFRSRRAMHDGTSRGLEIHFGDIIGKESYTIHGLIAPAPHRELYLSLLALLVFLLLIPPLVRRLYRFYESLAS